MRRVRNDTVEVVRVMVELGRTDVADGTAGKDVEGLDRSGGGIWVKYGVYLQYTV